MPETEINLIKNNLIHQLSPQKIYLFGSYAKGIANEDSDFDFYIVVKDGTEHLMELTAEAYRSIRDVRSRAVYIIIATESHFEERKHRMGLENEVANTGVLLYAV